MKTVILAFLACLAFALQSQAQVSQSKWQSQELVKLELFIVDVTLWQILDLGSLWMGVRNMHSVLPIANTVYPIFQLVTRQVVRIHGDGKLPHPPHIVDSFKELRSSY